MLPPVLQVLLRGGSAGQFETRGGRAMNQGPLIFFGLLATFIASWWGMIFAPHLQIGSQQTAQTDTGLYPARRAGLALQGHAVYVANGCVQCHSQQVRQESYTFEVALIEPGTNAPKVEALLAEIGSVINPREALTNASDKSPQTLLTNVTQSVAEDAQARLKQFGAKAQVVFIPIGTDTARGWGARHSVAADYLYEYPVQIGNSRLGPDLANVGARMPDANWHLLHLYEPRTQVKGSVMPAHRYLFETRPVGKKPSPNALKLPEEFAPKSDRADEKLEVVPKEEALQLVAYLQSLRVDTALFEAPTAQMGMPSAAAATNAPPDTNAPAAAKP
jgi:cbb3-type cytochrome oxidase cytochrome c subunit